MREDYLKSLAHILYGATQLFKESAAAMQLDIAERSIGIYQQVNATIGTYNLVSSFIPGQETISLEDVYDTIEELKLFGDMACNQQTTEG